MRDDDDNPEPPARSRLDRPRPRPYRVLSRTSGRLPPRARKQLPIAELIGSQITAHRLTEEVRQRVVCLYWLEIAGEKIASKTFPVSLYEGELHLAATSSAWVQEMQYYKARVIAQVHVWFEANRVWLGSPPLLTDIRVVLGAQRREPLVDPEHARRLRMRDLQRMMRRTTAPPVASDVERQAIIAETSVVEDDELRATIALVRTRWNR